MIASTKRVDQRAENRATYCSASIEPSNGIASNPSTNSSRTCSTAAANASSSAIQASLPCNCRRSRSMAAPGRRAAVASAASVIARKCPLSRCQAISSAETEPCWSTPTR